MSGITEQQAYISVTRTGFVDGACFTESADSASWVAEQKSAGFIVKIVDRQYAKQVVFTQLDAAFEA